MTTLIGMALAFGALWVPLAWVAAAGFAGHVAGEKGRCSACWFFWGILFGPLSLIAAVGLPTAGNGRGQVAAYPLGGDPTPEKLPSVFDKPGSKWVLVFIVVVLVAAYLFKQHSA